MVSRTTPIRPRRLSALLFLVTLACGGADEGPVDARPRTAEGVPLAVRSDDPNVRAVRAALENGELETARRLLPQVPEALGVEVALLRARLALQQGDAVGALREVEVARRAAGGDGRVHATEAEILAALGRLEAGEEAYRRGLELAGPLPDLERARGVLRLATPGRQREGLEALLRARKQDPTVPFVDWPLSQARLLVGRQALQESPAEAVAHARAGLECAPTSLELRELEADALAAQLEFDAALEIYAELAARGRDLGDTRAILHHRAATAALVAKERERAVEHYLAARELGMDDEGLGFGVTLLAEEARAAADEGFAAIEAEDYPTAQARFERALRLDPESLEALQFLGVAHFRQEHYREAAQPWERLLAIARVEGLELPDPIELNLARAWHLAGETARARAIVRSALEHDPEGTWSTELRFLLRQLDG